MWLKVAEVYPDSVDSDDRIKFTYNRQGEVTTKTDQNGTVHSHDFDKLGRRRQKEGRKGSGLIELCARRRSVPLTAIRRERYGLDVA